MLKFFRGLLGGNKEVPFVPVEAPVQMQPVMGGGGATTSEAPVEEDFSISREAGKIFAAALKRVPVVRHGYKVMVAPQVTEAAFGIDPGFYTPTLRKEHALLTVTLKGDVVDYDPQALNAAIRTVLGTVPALAGKLNPKQVHIPANHASAWTELKPLLQKQHGGKPVFSEHDLAMMEQFFVAQEVEDGKHPWYSESAIKAQHMNGKVSIEINAKELPHDKAEVGSTDTVIVDYFKEHHDAFLAKIKEKALALGLMEAKDLEHLECYVTATPWRVEFKLGTKYPVANDPQTNIPYTEMQLAEKMTETALAKVDTEKLEDIFTDALLEIGPQLPPITARVLDGPLLKKIVHKRMGQHPEIEAVLNRHEIFKSEDEKTAELSEKAAKHMVDIEDFTVDRDKPNKLHVKFDFPDGVSMGEIMQGIYDSKSQMMVAAQPRSGMSVSKAGGNRLTLEQAPMAPGAAA